MIGEPKLSNFKIGDQICKIMKIGGYSFIKWGGCDNDYLLIFFSFFLLLGLIINNFTGPPKSQRYPEYINIYSFSNKKNVLRTFWKC
jgi:hypothetical protein